MSIEFLENFLSFFRLKAEQEGIASSVSRIIRTNITTNSEKNFVVSGAFQKNKKKKNKTESQKKKKKDNVGISLFNQDVNILDLMGKGEDDDYDDDDDEDDDDYYYRKRNKKITNDMVEEFIKNYGPALFGLGVPLSGSLYFYKTSPYFRDLIKRFLVFSYKHHTGAQELPFEQSKTIEDFKNVVTKYGVLGGLDNKSFFSNVNKKLEELTNDNNSKIKEIERLKNQEVEKKKKKQESEMEIED